MSVETLALSTALINDSSEGRECVITPREQDDLSEQFWAAVAPLLDELSDQVDLQSDRAGELNRELDELLEVFVDNPAISMKAEFQLLTQLYQDRSVSHTDSLGSTYTEFVTRDSSAQSIDHHFRLITFSNAKQWLRDETTFDNTLETPCIFLLQDDTLTVTRRRYHRGEWTEVALESSVEHEMIKKFFKDTLLAAHLAYTRHPEEVETANRAALALLYQQYTLH